MMIKVIKVKDDLRGLQFREIYKYLSLDITKSRMLNLLLNSCVIKFNM